MARLQIRQTMTGIKRTAAVMLPAVTIFLLTFFSWDNTTWSHSFPSVFSTLSSCNSFAIFSQDAHSFKCSSTICALTSLQIPSVYNGRRSCITLQLYFIFPLLCIHQLDVARESFVTNFFKKKSPYIFSAPS